VGRGWKRDSFRHSLAAQGIDSTTHEPGTPIHLDPFLESVVEKPKPPERKKDEIGQYERHFRRLEPFVVDYPPGLKTSDKILYNKEMEEAQIDGTMSDVYEKWSIWKEFKRGNKKPKLVANIEYGYNENQPYFVTEAETPPDGFRWVDESEEDIAKDRVLGQVTQFGTYNEFPEFMTLEEYNIYSGYKRPPRKKDTSSKKRDVTKGREDMSKIAEERLKKYRKHKDVRVDEYKERMKK